MAMNKLCRLCLHASPDMAYNLHENNELTLKISSCLHLELLYDDSLPNQICQICSDQVDQMFECHKTIIENQNMLYRHLNEGRESLENLYNLLRNVETENKINIEIKVEKVMDIEPEEIPLKHEDEDNFIDKNDSSSDEDVTLSTLKEMKQESDVQSKPTVKVGRKTKTATKYKVSSNETKSNTLEINENFAQIIEDSQNLSTNAQEWKCLTCFEVFNLRKDLCKHYKLRHTPKDLPQPDKNDYTIIEIDGNKQYKCGKCKKSYKLKKHVTGHILDAHQENRPYHCNLCGRAYRSIHTIIYHGETHSGVKLFCSHKCGFNTTYRHHLRLHEAKHKQDYKDKYNCEKCGAGFRCKSWYEEHQNVHTGSKPFVCETCGKAYPFKRYLVRHITDSHPATHPSSEHTRYHCLHCSLACGTKFDLNKHLAEEHGLKQEFLCDVCGKAFKKPNHLKVHKQTHTGLKNYTCSPCKKSFTTLSHLRRHELTHIGFRRHACTHCTRRYTHKAALLKHIQRLHSISSTKSVE